jgi:hypothetical protein
LILTLTLSQRAATTEKSRPKVRFFIVLLSGNPIFLIRLPDNNARAFKVGTPVFQKTLSALAARLYDDVVKTNWSRIREKTAPSIAKMHSGVFLSISKLRQRKTFFKEPQNYFTFRYFNHLIVNCHLSERALRQRGHAGPY